MEEALTLVQVSKAIKDALLNHKGELAEVLDLLTAYENASFQEVSRLLLLKNIEDNKIYDAYVKSLAWYKDLFSVK